MPARNRHRWVIGAVALLGVSAAAGLAVVMVAGSDEDPVTTPVAPDETVATTTTGPSGSTTPEATTTTVPTTTLPPGPRPDVVDTIWVSSGGDDANSGVSPEQPFASVAAALAAAGPGDFIQIGAGTWPALEVFDKAATAEAPITLHPAPGADGQVLFAGGSQTVGYAASIQRSVGITIDGLVFEGGLSGVQVFASSAVVLRNNEIRLTGQEALAVQQESANVLIEDNWIHDTGQWKSQFGEGIYLGNGTTGLDLVNTVTIRGNEISLTSGEAIDVKPSVYDVVIEANRIHDIATSTSGAVVVGIGTVPYPDPNVVIRDNEIWNITTTSIHSDGNAIVLSAPATVTGNVITNVEHRGILVDGNFTDRNALNVIITGNRVEGFGINGIEVYSGPNPAIADVRDNTVL